MMTIICTMAIFAIAVHGHNLPPLSPCEAMTEEHHNLGLHALYTDIREPDEWRGGNMSEVIQDLLKELPFDAPDYYLKTYFTDIVYIKIDGKRRRVEFESGNPKNGWTSVIDKLLKADPKWIPNNIEFLWAREYFDTLYLKTALRKYAMLKLEMKEEDVPAYQDKIIKLFEKVPVFMSSQVTNCKKDAPLYEDKCMQERAFEIPDKFLMQSEIYWCPMYSQIIEATIDRPFQSRQETAFFYGPSTGVNRRTFSFQSSDPQKIDDDKLTPELIQQWWPSQEETVTLIEQNPRVWLRAYAANFSYYNPSYLAAYLQGHNIALEHLAQQIDDIEDRRITLCLQQNRLDKDDACMSNFHKFQDHTVQHLGGDNMVQLYMQHKYALHLDGETSPWLILPMQLLAGMVVLKPDTPNHQWFYDGLQPYTHFVPVKSDLSDLKTKIDWLRHNPKEAEFISENAQLFARYYLNPEMITKKFKKQFSEYHHAYRQGMPAESLADEGYAGHEADL